ncbi:MAG: S-methyl-5'-thioadenosine phosphorylase [Anaerolineae bacterium]|nr:S-methyl-5'-thioadenosine phosphorylase [Anaerolineae bacterium]
MDTDPIRIAVIGGSGLYAIDELTDVEERNIDTPFGLPSDAIVVGTLRGQRVAFLPRHGRGHVHTPGQVPYRANIFALKTLGVKHIIGVSACGSLQEQYAPGHIVIPDQLFDYTKDERGRTFFGGGLVAHVSIAEPFCPALSQVLYDACTEAGGVTVHKGGTFITIEGPRFSTKGESGIFRKWGCDIIGMTTSPEAYLAREAEMCYAVIAHVTDYDVWHESEAPVTVEMVIRTLQANIAHARRSITLAVEKVGAMLGEPCAVCHDALKYAFITAPDRVPPAAIAKIRPIVGRYFGEAE